MKYFEFYKDLSSFKVFSKNDIKKFYPKFDLFTNLKYMLEVGAIKSIELKMQKFTNNSTYIVYDFVDKIKDIRIVNEDLWIKLESINKSKADIMGFIKSVHKCKLNKLD